MPSDLPRTTLEQWAALAAVVDRGGFEAAAQTLSRSQSSVSYAIRHLQGQLPVPLLASQGRRSVLTAPGAMLLQRARLILEEARRLEQLAVTLSLGWEPEVRLAVELLVPPDLLLCSLARFGERAPQTRVQLIESVLSGTCEALAQRQVDLAVTAQVPPGFLGDPLTQVELVAVAAVGHPLHALGRPLGQEDLRQHRQVVIRDTGRYRQADSGWLGADQRWTVSHLHTAIDVIRRGLAYAWVPQDYVAEDLARGTLSPLPLERGGSRRETLYLVLGDRQGAGPATRALAQALVEQAEQRGQ